MDSRGGALMGVRAVVAGVGMVRFAKPGQSEPYPVMAAQAAAAALRDADVEYADIGQCYAGYVYGDSTCGQAALYRLGLTGIPIFNVNNNCSTGSSALFLARQAVESGAAPCVLAVGFEQMVPGALKSVYQDRDSPLQAFETAMQEVQGIDPQRPVAAQYFGGAARAHMAQYGTRPETFARIAVKARQHGARNPNAVFRQPLALEEVLASPMIFDPLTRLQCCPPTCGAAAAVVCTPEFARRNGAADAVEIVAQAMTTDAESTFRSHDMRRVVGFDMAAAAARAVYEASGIGPGDVDVVELHDCFTANELISYEALGLVREGEAERFVLDGDNTYGGGS